MQVLAKSAKAAESGMIMDGLKVQMGIYHFNALLFEKNVVQLYPYSEASNTQYSYIYGLKYHTHHPDA